jgi:O-antigen ligase
MRHLPAANQRVDRRTLWDAALRIAAEHPVAGIGPDNFRQVYGRYIGRATWDTRVHANNMYLEVLAGGGVVGAAALLWLVGASGLLVWRLWAAASPSAATAPAILVAVWLVIAGHGLVDSFLSFTTTYVSFALAAGIACSPALSRWTTPHADRV